jgi:hypothetical protein
MVSLKELLDVHQAYSQETPLSGVLGDGYLYANNRVYRNIRDCAIRIGIEYTAEDFCNYRVLPLAALPEILARNKVPFHDNVTPLTRVSKSRAGQLQMSEFPALRPTNYLMHESAHCIGASILGKELNFSGTNSPEAVLKILMGESFANTVEALANAYVDSEVHSETMRLNSYLWYGMGPRRKTTWELLDILGPKNGFRFLFVSFLFSNFCYQELKPKGVRLIHSLVAPEISLNPVRLGVLRRASELAFELNKDFRTTTAKFYFQFLGSEIPLEELLNFNFLSRIFKDERLLAALDLMADMFETGARTHASLSSRLKTVA